MRVFFAFPADVDLEVRSTYVVHKKILHTCRLHNKNMEFKRAANETVDICT